MSDEFQRYLNDQVSEKVPNTASPAGSNNLFSSGIKVYDQDKDGFLSTSY